MKRGMKAKYSCWTNPQNFRTLLLRELDNEGGQYEELKPEYYS